MELLLPFILNMATMKPLQTEKELHIHKSSNDDLLIKNPIGRPRKFSYDSNIPMKKQYNTNYYKQKNIQMKMKQTMKYNQIDDSVLLPFSHLPLDKQFIELKKIIFEKRLEQIK